MHLCTVPAVQLAINCALSLDLLPINICDLESILYLFLVCENDASKKNKTKKKQNIDINIYAGKTTRSEECLARFRLRPSLLEDTWS